MYSFLTTVHGVTNFCFIKSLKQALIEPEKIGKNCYLAEPFISTYLEGKALFQFEYATDSLLRVARDEETDSKFKNIADLLQVPGIILWYNTDGYLQARKGVHTSVD